MRKTRWNLIKFHILHFVLNLLKRQTYEDYIYSDLWKIGVVIGSKIALETSIYPHAVTFRNIESKDWDNYVRFRNHEKYIEVYFYADDLHEYEDKELDKACGKIENAVRVLKLYKIKKPIKAIVRSMHSQKILVEEDY